MHFRSRFSITRTNCISYDTNELREIIPGKTSLMPHDYDKVLSPQEYQDLVAMLARQVHTTLHVHQDGEGEVGR